MRADKEIIAYKITTSLTLAGLEGLIVSNIRDGWEPHGTFVVDGKYYAQAMIKRAER